MNIDLRNRVLPVALVAALLGGTVGAFVSRSGNSNDAVAKRTELTSPSTSGGNATTSELTNSKDLSATATDAVRDGQSSLTNADDTNAEYRDGFADGFRAADESRGTASGRQRLASSERSGGGQRVVYTPAPTRTRYSRANRSYAGNSRYDNSRQVYYDYDTQPRKRSFWQKHRDKLTVAAGTGGGALLGGLIGGKKGALIGALAGGGGSALYTYKLRNRSRRY